MERRDRIAPKYHALILFKKIQKKVDTHPPFMDSSRTHRNNTHNTNTMRTKALLLTAALSTLGVASSMAQVYSVNAVGYVNVECVPGFSLIANPLVAPSSTLTALIPNPPPGTSVYKFNAGVFSISTFDEFDLVWTPNPNETLDFGSGAFVRNPTASPFTITFVGEVAQGLVQNPIPSGFSIRSSKIPQSGLVTSVLQFPAQAGDSIYKWNPGTQQFNIFTYDEFDLVWTPSEPTANVGESFFVLKQSAGSWDRNFSVN